MTAAALYARPAVIDVFVEIETMLGPDALSQGLFDRHRHALRLELSRGGTPIEQFVGAIDRVRVLVDDLFGACPVVTAVVWTFMNDAGNEARVYAQLQALGVQVPTDAPWRVRRITPEDP